MHRAKRRSSRKRARRGEVLGFLQFLVHIPNVRTLSLIHIEHSLNKYAEICRHIRKEINKWIKEKWMFTRIDTCQQVVQQRSEAVNIRLRGRLRLAVLLRRGISR